MTALRTGPSQGQLGATLPPRKRQPGKASTGPVGVQRGAHQYRRYRPKTANRNRNQAEVGPLPPRLRPHRAIKGLPRRRIGIGEFEEAGRGRGLCVDSVPRAHQIGGALQPVAEAGEAIELDEEAAGVVRQESEPGQRHCRRCFSGCHSHQWRRCPPHVPQSPRYRSTPLPRSRRNQPTPCSRL